MTNFEKSREQVNGTTSTHRNRHKLRLNRAIGTWATYVKMDLSSGRAMFTISSASSNFETLSFSCATLNARFRLSRGASGDSLLKSIKSGRCLWIKAHSANPSFQDIEKSVMLTPLYPCVLRRHQSSKPSFAEMPSSSKPTTTKRRIIVQIRPRVNLTFPSTMSYSMVSTQRRVRSREKG